MADKNTNISRKKVIVEKNKRPVSTVNKRQAVNTNSMNPKGGSVNNRASLGREALKNPKTEGEDKNISTEKAIKTEEADIRSDKDNSSALKRERLRKIITIISGVVCILSFAYFTYYCLKADGTKKEAEALSDLKNSDVLASNNKKATVTLDLLGDAPDILEEYRTIYAKNKRLAGWISIEGTDVDYPVMQTTNNEYYLDHDFDQHEDKNGSIFIDSNCSIWPRSQNLIIYGHNMKSGRMFGDLDKYKSQKFYEAHKRIKFDTLYEKGEYDIMYVFPETVHEATEVTFKYYQFIDANSKEEYDSNMQTMAEMSLYDTGVTSQYGDKLITLSTCDYEEGAERFVVVAKKVK
ncbi:MAG: class B sortase [Lachnospiraceae bacterium]|nr:class B sortase [Lachnospiraceae bacterium]